MPKSGKIFVFLSLLTGIAFFSFGQIEFVENKGQWHQNVKFRGDMQSGSVFLEQNGFTILLHDTRDVERLSGIMHGHGKDYATTDPFIFHSFAYKVRLINASSSPEIIAEKTIPTYNNYFIGDDPSRWASGCKIHGAVTLKNIYPGIDIRYYSDAGRLKYDFIINPGGKITDIALMYEGPSAIKVKEKSLVIATPLGDVIEPDPYSYQPDLSGRKKVDVTYSARGNLVKFQAKQYDASRILVIDPTVIFSSFTGSSADNWGYTATPGPDGSFFAGGVVFGAGYPVSPGSYQSVFEGGAFEDQIVGYDISVFKFSPTGASRLYATYLGGSANEQPHSMICDKQGNLVVAGRSNSGNYPQKGLGQIGSGGAYDIIITKFNADGTNIIGSVKIGGSSNDGVNVRSKYDQPGPDGLRRNYGDDARSEVILDGANNIILASCTQSSNFPVIAPGLNSGGFFGGGRQDGVVLKFNDDLTSRSISSFFGGSGDDACFVCSIHPFSGNIYLAGGTTSVNLPGSKVGVFASGTSYQGGISDGFITQINANGTAIVKTAYLGTPNTDMVYGLKFDKAGFPYIMGTTVGSWPVINVNFSNPGGKQFISKLQPDFSNFVYSTVFGNGQSEPAISPIAFLVDRCENVYVSGWGGGINTSQQYSSGNTRGLPLANPLSQAFAPNDGQDFYFFVLEKNGASQLFGSCFGQNNGIGDHVDGGTSRFDDNGVIYQAICANCGNNVPFPTTPGVWSSSNGSSNCNQAAVKIEMNFTGVAASIKPYINGVSGITKSCIPFTVYFYDTLSKGTRYYWDFGNGQTNITTTALDTIRYTAPGVYTVTLVSEDSTKCNIRDTAQIVIVAGDNKVNLDFAFRKIPPCQNLSFEFTNTSVAPAGSNFSRGSFMWDFGDGSQPVLSGFTPPVTHTFPAPGTYTVTLKLLDTTFCNAPDQITKIVRVNTLVNADFKVQDTGCVPFAAIFENLSRGGTDFIWEFGDGTTSNDPSVFVSHTYTATGTYNVRLIAIDSNTCNITDTSDYFAVTVINGPEALFSWAPNPPMENTPVKFTNQSTGAVRYVWNFGDGQSSTEENPSYQYNESGEFIAELIAYNAQGCSDTFRTKVNVFIKALLDVPNAFTPGRFGENGIIKVKGFGIRKMIWRIYNRWGQAVFESNSPGLGWDGTFKGKLQPMDVYTYTLEAELSDGRKVKKSGDITLIR